MHRLIAQQLIDDLNALNEDIRTTTAIDALSTLVATIAEELEPNDRLTMWEAISKAMLLTSNVAIQKQGYIH